MKPKIESIPAIEFAKLLIYNDFRRFGSKQIVQPKSKKIFLGNLYLNKYLQIANMIYIGRNKKPLFNEPFVAFLNGGVIIKVWKKWDKLVAEVKKTLFYNQDEISKILTPNLNPAYNDFAHFLTDYFKDAHFIELLHVAHDDPAWKAVVNKIDGKKTENVMNMIKFQKTYEKTYQEFWQS